MLLSDKDICAALKKDLVIDPFSILRLQPASYDVSLGNSLIVFLREGEEVDPRKPLDKRLYARIPLHDTGHYILNPGEFVLGSTVERVAVGKGLAVRVEGRSSLGRLGLSIHETAGFIDPGFEGQITLEIKNNGPFKLELRPGMSIGQLCIFKLSSDCIRPYGSEGLSSKYQSQDGVEISKGVGR